MDLSSRVVDSLPRILASVEAPHPTVWRRLSRRIVYRLLNVGIGLSIPFTRRNGFRVLSTRHGYLRARVSLRGNRNHIGTMYAGAIFLLAEIPGGVIALLAFGREYFPILKDMSVTYKQPAKTDLTVEYCIAPEDLDAIRRKADDDGKCDFTLEADLVDTTGAIVAHSVGHYQLRRRAR